MPRCLSSFSPDYEVMELLLNTCKTLSKDSDMLYDYVNETYISVDDVATIIRDMRDAEGMEI